MRFQTYTRTLILGLRQVTNYRFEMWLTMVTRMVGLSGLLVLWLIIYKDNPTLNVKEIVGYLLVANSVRDAIDAYHLRLAKEFITEIKQGTISSHLLRPIDTKLFFYFRYFGTRSVNLIFDLILFLIGVLLNPPKTVVGLGLFLISVIVGAGIAYCFNVMVGMVAFWTSEASGIRNVANHLIKVFSGALIPISYFPEISKNIILLSPFPVLAYLPATFISSTNIVWENVRSLEGAFLWLIGLIVLINWLWIQGVKNNESVGI